MIRSFLLERMGLGSTTGICLTCAALIWNIFLLSSRPGAEVDYLGQTAAFGVLFSLPCLFGIIISIVDIAKGRSLGWLGMLLCLGCMPLYSYSSEIVMRLLHLHAG